jgi:hypothetical protein
VACVRSRDIPEQASASANEARDSDPVIEPFYGTGNPEPCVIDGGRLWGKLAYVWTQTQNRTLGQSSEQKIKS